MTLRNGVHTPAWGVGVSVRRVGGLEPAWVANFYTVKMDNLS